MVALARTKQLTFVPTTAKVTAATDLPDDELSDIKVTVVADANRTKIAA